MALAPARDDENEVLGLNWLDFLDWFSKHWRQGQHVTLIGPTGVGKSTLATAVLPLRKFVLAMDPKGGDSTLATLEGKGFERILTWPPDRKKMKRLEEGKPVRLIVGGKTSTRSDIPILRRTIGSALEDAFDWGGFTIYIDELQIAADRRYMNLGGNIELLLIAARDKGVSVVSSFQRPANVPRSASDQASWLFVWYTRDVDVVGRLGEMAGRPRAEIRGAVRALGRAEHAVLLFSNNPSDPIVVTRAPRAS